MALQKLSNEIQSLFCATTQICNYKRAVEELVYNSLDAEATSIAIRVNIEENTIQVIDNGCGVSRNDYSLLGQRHATSKCVDLSNLKSAPNNYGFKGQSLASIIEVSKCVKLTSRCQNSEEAFVKSFYKGKVQELCEISQRPSKGTTVDIKGFLYSLKIQKKMINPLNEINDIKKFLEQLSLVHNNISLSLRDDAKNEIVIKLHKNRDIYQTLSSVFEINKEDLEELMVEKNQYKVTAYIGKKDKEVNQKHCLYLNGKFLQDSKLHTMINDYLKKALKLNLQTNRKVKSKNAYNEEDDVQKREIPCYFIFIKCPYHDYDVNYTLKKTVIEFKDWEQINKILEKLAKLYAGDIVLNKTKTTTNHVKNIAKEQNTRDEVKRIMEKILGTKKVGVSQMQKGIKGKIIKRKPKKQRQNICLGKIIPDNTNKVDLEVDNNSKEQSNSIVNEQEKEIKAIRTASEKDKIALTKPSKTKKKALKSEKCLKIKTNCIKYIKTGKNINKACNQQLRDKRDKTNKPCNLIVQKKKNTVPKTKLLKQKPKLECVLKKFDDPTNSVKKRCNILANKVDDMISYKTKRKRKVFINETVQYSNIVKNNKNYSVHKRIGEIVIHDYIPKPLKLNPCSFDDRIWENVKKDPHKSSYDLVQTILRTQETRNICTEEVDVSKIISTTLPDHEFSPTARNYEPLDDTPAILHLPKLTFDSHNYEGNINRSSHNYYIESQENQTKKVYKRFITTQSRNNFTETTSKQVKRCKKIKPKFLRNNDFKRSLLKHYDKNLNNSQDSSYNIEFFKSNEQMADHLLDKPIVNTLLTKENENRIYITNQSYGRNNTLLSRIDCTYNINSPPNNNNMNSKGDKNDEVIQCIDVSFDTVSYCLNSPKNISKEIECIKDAKYGKEEDDRNFIFISKSPEPKVDDVAHGVPVSQDKDIDPLTVCETMCSLDELEENHGELITDSRFRDDFDVDSLLCDRNIYTQRNFANFIDVNEIINGSLFHLSANNNQNSEPNETNPILKQVELDQLIHTANIENFSITNKSSNKCCEENKKDLKRFNLKNRLRFVPKGMSPIFENCQTRYINDSYDDGKNYYEETIYNNFTDNVRVNTKIFEPEIQNLKNLTTKAVEKVNSKLSKDNASLVFNGETLKHAQVLGQIDNKFIAAKVTGKPHKSHELSEYLVLFDQHAVHERIRLEDNLSDYFNGEQWKRIALDEITLKLPKDVITYLHNYKDKFGQLGLEWTVLDHGSVSITTIPEAILGKNPRQADIVMKAVKNLIVEEISVIKTQSGCITLYPKSIMDLVFSEYKYIMDPQDGYRLPFTTGKFLVSTGKYLISMGQIDTTQTKLRGGKLACRYAIKFGDRLSRNECVNLLNSLAECKTPFQCAHGRPVMAVLMEIKNEIRQYKVNMSNLCLWSQRKKQ